MGFPYWEQAIARFYLGHTSAIRKSDFFASISLLLVRKSDLLVSISLLLVRKSDLLVSISLLLVRKSDLLASISLLLTNAISSLPTNRRRFPTICSPSRGPQHG